MELITSGRSLSTLIRKLIDGHNKFSFAVAWASAATDVMQTILDNKEKIKHSVIGIHFYQTDTKVLQDFVGFNNVHFILQPSGVFHPKSYIFWTGTKYDIIIGSANMTKGAFNNNQEVSLYLSSEDNIEQSNIGKSLKATIKDMWSQGRTMDTATASTYGIMSSIHKPKFKSISGNYTVAKKNSSPLESKILTMSWDDYYKIIIADPNESFTGRCEILTIAKDLFENNSFSEMSVEERKAIGGLNHDFKGLDWGWFGSMTGAGVFHNRIIDNDQHISNALEAIPLKGSISYTEYINYIQEFVKAFDQARHGVGVASRLLAMKRPDYFLCYNKGNRHRLCEDFTIPQLQSNDYDRYWNDIILRIQDSVWWNSTPPKDIQQLSAWKGRAAMLDAIFYDI